MILLPLLAGGLLAGCGNDVVDDQKTEIALRFDVREATGEAVRSVSCPEEVAVVPGTTFECDVTTRSGLEAVATVEITDDDADLRVVSLDKP